MVTPVPWSRPRATLPATRAPRERRRASSAEAARRVVGDGAIAVGYVCVRLDAAGVAVVERATAVGRGRARDGDASAAIGDVGVAAGDPVRRSPGPCAAEADADAA